MHKEKCSALKSAFILDLMHVRSPIQYWLLRCNSAQGNFVSTKEWAASHRPCPNTRSFLQVRVHEEATEKARRNVNHATGGRGCRAACTWAAPASHRSHEITLGITSWSLAHTSMLCDPQPPRWLCWFLPGNCLKAGLLCNKSTFQSHGLSHTHLPFFLPYFF